MIKYEKTDHSWIAAAEASDTVTGNSHFGAYEQTNAQKAAFVIANKLSEPLEKAGIGRTALWDYIKRKYNAESRNDVTKQQWTDPSAELKDAETTSKLSSALCQRIKGRGHLKKRNKGYAAIVHSSSSILYGLSSSSDVSSIL